MSFVAPEDYRDTALEEILRVARDRHCDLIVLGSRGRTGLGRVGMGGVAEDVARRSPCPVLVVRSPHEVRVGEPEPAPTETRAAPQ